MRKLLFLLSFAVVFLSSENVSFAHPGGLDSNGGHTCRTNCAKWGLKDGQYHYHNPDGSISLTKPKPAPAPAPKPTPTPSTDIYYKDAVKQGDILQSELSQFNRAINSGNVYEIDKQYDDFTQQIKRTERAIGKVSGSTKRKELNNKYINNAKVAVERNIYEISQLRLVKKIDGLVKSNRVLEAQNEVAKLDRMKVRAADIKKAGGYAALPQGVYNGLFEQEKNMQLPLLEKSVQLFNQTITSGNIATIDAQYDNYVRQVRNSERIIGQVSGSNNRKALNAKYITPGKIAYERTKYEVSQYRLVANTAALVKAGNNTKVQEEIAKLERLKVRAQEIKQAGGYAPLPNKVYDQLKAQEEQALQGVTAPSGELAAHFLDVGQGDSILIKTQMEK